MATVEVVGDEEVVLDEVEVDFVEVVEDEVVFVEVEEVEEVGFIEEVVEVDLVEVENPLEAPPAVFVPEPLD